MVALLALPFATVQGVARTSEAGSIQDISLYLRADAEDPNSTTGTLSRLPPTGSADSMIECPFWGTIPLVQVLVGSWSLEPLHKDVTLDGTFSFELWALGVGGNVNFQVELESDGNTLLSVDSNNIEVLDGWARFNGSKQLPRPPLRVRSGQVIQVSIFYSADPLSRAELAFGSEVHPSRVSVPMDPVDVELSGLVLDVRNQTASLNISLLDAFGFGDVVGCWVEPKDLDWGTSVAEREEMNLTGMELNWTWNYSTAWLRKDRYSIEVTLEDGTGARWVRSIAFAIPAREEEAVIGYRVIAASTILGVSGIAILGWWSEVARYRALLLFFPLFTRLGKEDVLNQPTRHKIVGYVIGNPGANFGLIKQELGLENGQLAYHLQVLEREGEVVSRVDGRYRRYYPRSVPPSQREEVFLSEIQEALFKSVGEHEGISQKELARLVGRSRQVVGYHLDRLVDYGLVRKVKPGRKARYYVAGQ